MSLYLPLFKALNDANVQYVIVGGLATILHGYPRFTSTEKGMLVFSLYNPENPLLVVDLFVREPIPYYQLAERAVQMDLGGEMVKVCSISDLIEMKKNAARPKDIEDIKHLNELLQMKNDEENKK